jgi:site-specific recombinase XerC
MIYLPLESENLSLRQSEIQKQVTAVLANVGQDTRALQSYLGHRNIQRTVRYTELAPDRFNGLLTRLTRMVAPAAKWRYR